MNLRNFVKVNFLAGLFGSLVLSPLAYAYEFIQSGAGSPLLKFEVLDLVMLLAIPVIMAVAFGVTALAAFPVVALLQRRGLLSFAES
jgi:hypothetical protein